VPELDRDGDRWDPLWAVIAVSWEDAVAYAAWRSERDGVGWSLPSEQEWEKAARGADGRIFPWGHGFDPTLCKMRASRPGRPLPEAVGAFAADTSPYGVKDLAGGMRDWCGDASYGGDPKRRPIRGGSWITIERNCRAAHRNGIEPWIVSSNHGFRLARVAAAAGPLDG
jgi:serine/threonine-protein kinase